MADVDIPLLFDRDSSRVLLNGKRAEEFPLGCEALNAVIAEFAGVDHIVFADGKADVRAEFAWCFAVLAPLEHKARWRKAIARKAAVVAQRAEKADSARRQESAAREDR